MNGFICSILLLTALNNLALYHRINKIQYIHAIQYITYILWTYVAWKETKIEGKPWNFYVAKSVGRKADIHKWTRQIHPSKYVPLSANAFRLRNCLANLSHEKNSFRQSPSQSVRTFVFNIFET